MARRQKLIDAKQVEELARIGCTEEDMATVLGVSVDTLQRRKRTCAEFRGAIEKGRASLRNSLRRLQVKKALEGNVTMLIWLGKQLLGQSDRQSTELSGPEGVPLLPDAVVLALAELAAAAADAGRGLVPPYGFHHRGWRDGRATE